MLVLVTSALVLLAISGPSSALTSSHRDEPSESGAATPPLEGGPLNRLYKDHFPSVVEENRPKHDEIKVESPQLYIMPTEIDYQSDEESSRSARQQEAHQPLPDPPSQEAHHQEEHQPLPDPPSLRNAPGHAALNNSKLFFDPALLVNLTSLLTGKLLLNNTDTGLNITFNINPANLTLSVTPLTSGPSIFNPLNLPIPFKGTSITLPIPDAMALLNITGPAATALAALLVPVSPLTWLLPAPPKGLPGIFPNMFPNMFPGFPGFPGGFPGGFPFPEVHHTRPTSVLRATITVTSTSVLRSYVTEMSTQTFTYPKVSYSTVVIPSTSTSTIIVPNYQTTSVVVTLMSTSTVIIPQYETVTHVPHHPHHHHHHQHHRPGYQHGYHGYEPVYP